MVNVRRMLGVGMAAIALLAVWALRTDHSNDGKGDAPNADPPVSAQAAERAVAPVVEERDTALASIDELSTESATSATREQFTSRIEGIVVFEDGRPAPGATVTLRSLAADPLGNALQGLPAGVRSGIDPPKLAMRELSAISGPDGRFVITDVGEESWSIDCLLDGYRWKRTRPVARAGSRWTIQLIAATRVEIEFVSETGLPSEYESVLLVFSGNEGSLEGAWRKERPHVDLPPGEYRILVQAAKSPSSFVFGLGSLDVEPGDLEVRSSPQRIVLRIRSVHELTVRVKDDPRFSRDPELLVWIDPCETAPGVERESEFAGGKAQPVSSKSAAVFRMLRTNCVTVRLSTRSLIPVLAERRVDLRVDSSTIEFDPATLDFGDEIDVEFRSARSSTPEIVTIESSRVKSGPFANPVIATPRRANKHYAVFVDREARMSALAADPNAVLLLDVRHSSLGRHTFEIPLATSRHSCVFRTPATLDVKLQRAKGSTERGWVLAIARFEGGRWQTCTKSVEMAWTDTATLGPVEPGDYSLIVALDHSLERVIQVEPISLVEGANLLTVALPLLERAELQVESPSECEITVESIPSGGAGQRVQCFAGKRTIAVELPRGSYRAIARGWMLFQQVDFQVPSSTPIRLVPTPIDRFEIASLDAEGALAAAGLEVGDVLTDISGMRLSEIDESKWRELRFLSESAAFGFERGGQRVEVRLDPRQWLADRGPRDDTFSAQVGSR